MDIRTLTSILGIIQLAEVLLFSLLASVNRSYRGIGYWLAGSAVAAVGFVFLLLRVVPGMRLAGTLAQDPLIVLALYCFYLGILRFFERPVPRSFLAAFFAAFLAVHVWFTLGADDIVARTIALCVAVAVVSLLAAAALWRRPPPAVRATAGFLAAAFLLNGAYFVYRGTALLLGASLDDMFNPTLFNASALLNGITMSILWTGGLIIMVGQRANAEIVEAKEHFESIFATSPDAALITTVDDGIIVDVNHGFGEMTGFRREDVVGRSILAVDIWRRTGDREALVRRLREAGTASNFEAEFRRRDGSFLYGQVAAKIIQLRGRPHILSVTRDITLRKRDEERIRALLQEKEVLLREVHHRVKNNMNAAMGLLTLQAQTAAGAEAGAALHEARGRLQAMAVLYDKLYRSENLRAVGVGEYLPPLVDEVVRVFPAPARIAAETRVEPFTLGVEVLSPLGIIVNELLTNALKHAFSGRDSGRILVSAARTGGSAVITVEDDGVGMPAAPSADGFGTQLTEMLAKQIGGSLRREAGAGGNGTRCILEFPAG
jgi:PAS domain S-box-containing protein